MMFLYILLSLYNPNPNYQKMMLEEHPTREQFWQGAQQIKYGKNYLSRMVGCHYAFTLHEQNRIKESQHLIKYCMKLGGSYRELTRYLEIKNLFALSDTKLLYKIYSFEKTFSDSVFLEEIKGYRPRFYFKKGRYAKSYYSWKSFLKEYPKQPYHQKRIIDYMRTYSRTQFLKKALDRFIVQGELLNYREFLGAEDIKKIKKELIDPDIKLLNTWINELLTDQKYGYLSVLIRRIRINRSDLFDLLIQEKNRFKRYPQVDFTYKLQRHIYQKRHLKFEAQENALDKLITEFKTEHQRFALYYQKALLYRRYKKHLKRVANYQKMLTLKLSRKKQANYLFKSGVYALEGGDHKNAKIYFESVIKKFNRWYPQYYRTYWMLFQMARDAKNKKEMAYYLGKLTKSSYKPIAYYYLLKDKLATKKEQEKIEAYFKVRPHFFYGKMINKQLHTGKESWKLWTKLFDYEKVTPPKERITSPRYALYKAGVALEKIFPEGKLLKQLATLRVFPPGEKIVQNLYDKIYKLLNTSKKRLDEAALKSVTALKAVKTDYLRYFLNFFIATENYHYAYLLTHRHHKRFRYDPKGLYYPYFHPFAYSKYVDQYAKEFNIHPFVILSIMEAESIFNPKAYSSAGAIGLMQVMPRTGAEIAKSLKVTQYDLFNPKDNIRFGAYYISNLLKRFKYQLPFAAAGYNGGPHNVHRWLQGKKEAKPKIDEMIDAIGFKESRHYAKKIIRLFSTYRKMYQQRDTPIPLEITFDEDKTLAY